MESLDETGRTGHGSESPPTVTSKPARCIGTLAILAVLLAVPALCALCLQAGAARALPPPIDTLTEPGALPKLRPPHASPAPGLSTAYPPLVSALVRHGSPLQPPRPLAAAWRPRQSPEPDLPGDAASLRAALLQEVAGVTLPSRRVSAQLAERAAAMMEATSQSIATPQIVLVVDRNPSVERLTIMLARPGGPAAWRALGSVHVSTGQAGRKDYYITPIGVFSHTDAILDFRAQGTYNEHHVRGLGLAGMRVWDFGWQWALKGWHTDGEGGDIRLQMHATDPTLLERRLGRPASEGCIRLSSSMNRFLDRHGVLDADYEHAALQDGRYRALLAPDRTPTPLAGRLRVVIDSSLPPDAPPTAASRPPNWPKPEPTQPPGAPAAPGAPGTDTATQAPVH